MISLDTSPKNINYLKGKFPKADFIISDCSKINLPDESVDVIFCSAVVEHFEDPILVLKEIKRVLKKEGLFILTGDIRPKITYPLRKKMILYAYKDLPASHPSIHKLTYFSDRKSYFFIDEQKLISYLKKDYTLINKKYGGGIFTNVFDSILLLLEKVTRNKNQKYDTPYKHYQRLDKLSVKLYIKLVLPLFKFLAKFDSCKLDAFFVLLVLKKK